MLDILRPNLIAQVGSESLALSQINLLFSCCACIPVEDALTCVHASFASLLCRILPSAGLRYNTEWTRPTIVCRALHRPRDQATLSRSNRYWLGCFIFMHDCLRLKATSRKRFTLILIQFSVYKVLIRSVKQKLVGVKPTLCHRDSLLPLNFVLNRPVQITDNSTRNDLTISDTF